MALPSLLLLLYVMFIALPPDAPTITVISRHLDDCGEARILNCSYPVDNLFNPPTVMWIGPDGKEMLDSDPAIRPLTGELIFSDITSNNSGLYVCRTVVNIPESQIFNHTDDATVSIDIQCEDCCQLIAVVVFAETLLILCVCSTSKRWTFLGHKRLLMFCVQFQDL